KRRASGVFLERPATRRSSPGGSPGAPKSNSELSGPYVVMIERGGSSSMDQFNQQQPAWISASTNEMAERARAMFRSVYVGMFGVMSVYGMVTKRDLTSWGSFFFMGLIGIVICSVVNIFLHSSGLAFVISVVGVFVFIGLTAWDTQKIKSYATAAGPDMQEK